MSAKVVDFSRPVSSALSEAGHCESEFSEDKGNLINTIRFEILYQLYVAAEPTDQQIAMEEFLLECD